MGSQRWLRSSIVARRIKRYQHMSALVLLTEPPGAAPLQIMLMYRFDAEFERWLAGIRDLDAEEKQVIATGVAAAFAL